MDADARNARADAYLECAGLLESTSDASVGLAVQSALAAAALDLRARAYAIRMGDHDYRFPSQQAVNDASRVKHQNEIAAARMLNPDNEL
jgi:hypothetical protein